MLNASCACVWKSSNRVTSTAKIQCEFFPFISAAAASQCNVNSFIFFSSFFWTFLSSDGETLVVSFTISFSFTFFKIPFFCLVACECRSLAFSQANSKVCKVQSYWRPWEAIQVALNECRAIFTLVFSHLLCGWKCHATQTIRHLTAFVQIPNLNAQQFAFPHPAQQLRPCRDSGCDKRRICRPSSALTFCLAFDSFCHSGRRRCCVMRNGKIGKSNSLCWCVAPRNPQMHRILHRQWTLIHRRVKKVCAFCQQMDMLRYASSAHNFTADNTFRVKGKQCKGRGLARISKNRRLIPMAMPWRRTCVPRTSSVVRRRRWMKVYEFMHTTLISRKIARCRENWTEAKRKIPIHVHLIFREFARDCCRTPNNRWVNRRCSRCAYLLLTANRTALLQYIALETAAANDACLMYKAFVDEPATGGPSQTYACKSHAYLAGDPSKYLKQNGCHDTEKKVTKTLGRMRARCERENPRWKINGKLENGKSHFWRFGARDSRAAAHIFTIFNFVCPVLGGVKHTFFATSRVEHDDAVCTK